MTEPVEVLLTPPELLPNVWEYARDLLLTASRPDWGEDTVRILEDIHEGIAAGDKQLWMFNVPDRVVGALVTQIIVTKFYTYCDLTIYATEKGYHADVVAWLPFIQSWAIQQGCTKMRAVGRMGWCEALKPFGFSYAATICTTDLGQKFLH